MKLVLDTNVLVSGLLTPFGPCGDLVRMLTSGAFALCVDARILLEYDEVLRRPRFGFDPPKVESVMAYIRSVAQPYATVPLRLPLPDDDDAPFLEVAISAKADGLITGNKAHFPADRRLGVPVLSPREFLAKMVHGNVPK
ncbi:MAG: putative toxin-antitoxin system toxin component, PIN family [FCB group bacterium]|jgi:putative PIN family toxin of toxin-antitoxin system|nr:putative toxin-antitoxin system toxin component, PIN family [FCB group bacterium]